MLRKVLCKGERNAALARLWTPGFGGRLREQFPQPLDRPLPNAGDGPLADSQSFRRYGLRFAGEVSFDHQPRSLVQCLDSVIQAVGGPAIRVIDVIDA